jgi:hypothetical protein
MRRMTEDTPTNATPEASDVALTARLAPSFFIRNSITAIVMLVLGLWGVWDYVEVIPTQERYFARAEVARAYIRFAEPVVSGASSPDSAALVAFMTEVVDDLQVEGEADAASEIAGLKSVVEAGDPAAIDRLHSLIVTTVLPKAMAESETRQSDGVSQTSPVSRGTWFAVEAAMVAASRLPTTALGEASNELKLGLAAAQSQVNLYGETEQPSTYDRPMQWLFMLCLPFVPWYLWQIVRSRGQEFRLLTDGSLDLPGEHWSADELADIDMSRWMKTSKAWVVHTDGHRVMLDDYVFKGSFRIIGAIASARYPDAWTDEAKVVKPAKVAEDQDDAGA